jgi:hypothetical protein
MNFCGKAACNLFAIEAIKQAWAKVTKPKFGFSEYTDPTGRKLPQYELSKLACLYISIKINDIIRAKLIKPWKELEKKNTSGFFNPWNCIRVCSELARRSLKSSSCKTSVRSISVSEVFFPLIPQYPPSLQVELTTAAEYSHKHTTTPPILP